VWEPLLFEDEELTDQRQLEFPASDN
jgi:hypothetical protein